MSNGANFPHLVIRASAGTGKTYQLAVRFISILVAGGEPEEILATTFTRKAAGEILDRVLYWLAAAAADDQKRLELSSAIGSGELSRKQCCKLLRQTVSRLHALRIGTLDSYFLRVATSFGHELGLPPGWSICDEMADALLREEAIEQVLTARVSDLLTLVHALTKGVASRSVARLVNDTVTSLLELYRETTPEAWQQIKTGQPLQSEELDDALHQLESLAISDKRMCGARVEDLARFRAETWEDFLAKGLSGKVQSGQYVYYNKPLPDDVIACYQRLLKHVEAIVVGQVARQTEATRHLLERFVERYETLQLGERALRFSDVAFYLARAAGELSPERLAFRLDGGVRHVLLDEFQDTSPVQWRVLRPLAQKATREPGGSFFCVGDGKQAIYGWRGGVAAIFDALSAELTDLKSSNLAKSFRSSQPVIDAVNEVFLNLSRHPHLDKLADPVNSWQRAYTQHTTERVALQGYVELCTSPAAGDEERQADVTLAYAAARIKELVAAAPHAEVGVLVRTNSAVARLIYELRRLGIPASEEGGNPLTDSPAVELILSLLKLADHPSDTAARFHLATSPLAGPLDVEDYDDEAKARRLSQSLRRKLLEEGYGAAIFAWAQKLAPECDQRDRTRLQQLVELAYEYQRRSTLRTSDFLRLVESRRIADPQAAAVRVMTIHQAKGLEFDIVVLPELDVRLVGQPDRVVAGRPSPTEPVHVVCRLANEHVRQFFPPELKKLFDDDLCLEVHESLCLLYVAMTRAAHALHMIVPPAKASEKIVPKTFAGLVRATLAPGLPATSEVRLYEHGNPRWHATASAKSSFAETAETVSAKTPAVPVIKLARQTSQRERGLERTSPSALEGGKKLPGALLLRQKADIAFDLGTLVHAWFAEIEWLDNGMPNESSLEQVAKRVRSQMSGSLPSTGALISRFKQQIQQPQIGRLLSRAFYEDARNLSLSGRKVPPGPFELQVERERSFAIRQNDGILTGSIDRLVIVRSEGKTVAADVIDFKTDELRAGDRKALQTKLAFYRPQIEAYRQAAAHFLRLPLAQISARLAFLSGGVVEPLV